MNRLLLAILFLVPITTGAQSRLIGTWKSDRDASMAFNAAHAILKPEQRDFLEQVFGYMTLTFTPKTLIWQMPDVPLRGKGESTTFSGSTGEVRYHELGAVADSVAVKIDDYFGRDCILHLHFVSPSRFWTYSEDCDVGLVNVHVREYFNRVEG